MSQPSSPGPAKTPPKPRPRGNRKLEVGTVTTDRMAKTRRVEVQRLLPHPKYGKLQKRRTVCYVHDERNESRIGDLVEIMETRPLSRSKRWRLVRIVRKAPAHEEADRQAQANQGAAPADENHAESESESESESE